MPHAKFDSNYQPLTTELRSFNSHWLQTKYPNHVPVKLFVITDESGRFFVPKFCKQIEILGEYDLYEDLTLSNYWDGVTDTWLYELYMHKSLVRKNGNIRTLASRNLYFDPLFAAIAFDCSGENPRMIGYQASSKRLTSQLTRLLKQFNTSKMTPDNIRTVLGKSVWSLFS